MVRTFWRYLKGLEAMLESDPRRRVGAGEKKNGNSDALSGPVWEIAHAHLRRIRAPRHSYHASTPQNPVPKTVQSAQSKRPTRKLQGIAGQLQSLALVFLAPTWEQSPPRHTYMHVRTHTVRCCEEHSGVQKVPANFHFFRRCPNWPPPRNSRKISSFRHRNQITNAHVHTRSVNSS
jgi:hypothetical protein